MPILKTSFVLLVLARLSAAAAAPALQCPIEGFSGGGPPKIAIQAGNGYQLIVCGGQEKNPAPGWHLMTGFDVYAVDSKGKFSEAIKSASATEYYVIREEKETLVLEENMQILGQRQPVFRQRITCTENGCEASAANCALVVTTKKPVKPPKLGKTVSKQDISQLLDSAISGNKYSQTLLLEKSGNLQVEGKAAEALADSASLVQRLKDAGCLK